MAFGPSGTERAREEVQRSPGIAPVNGAAVEGTTGVASGTQNEHVNAFAKNKGTEVAVNIPRFGETFEAIAGNISTSGRADVGIHQAAAANERDARGKVRADLTAKGFNPDEIAGAEGAAADQAKHAARAFEGARETKLKEGQEQGDAEMLGMEDAMANQIGQDQGQDQGLDLANGNAQDLADELAMGDRQAIPEEMALGQEQDQKISAGQLLSRALEEGIPQEQADLNAEQNGLELADAQDLQDGIEDDIDQSEDIIAAVAEHTVEVDEWAELRKSSKLPQAELGSGTEVAGLEPGETPAHIQNHMDLLADRVEEELASLMRKPGREAEIKPSGPVQYRPERSWVDRALADVENA